MHFANFWTDHIQQAGLLELLLSVMEQINLKTFGYIHTEELQNNWGNYDIEIFSGEMDMSMDNIGGADSTAYYVCQTMFELLIALPSYKL